MLADDGIAPDGGHGGHVQHLANAGPAAPASRGPLDLAAIAVQRSDADKGSDLLAVQAAELRQLGQQGSGADRTDARNRAQQVFLLSPGRTGADRLVDVVVGPRNASSSQSMCFLSAFFIRSVAAIDRRFFSIVSMSTIWRRRLRSSSSSLASGVGRGRGSGRMASANRAKTRASIWSVLASTPVALAKSRTCRGLTTATGYSLSRQRRRHQATRTRRSPPARRAPALPSQRADQLADPASSLATCTTSPSLPKATSSVAFETSIPT